MYANIKTGIFAGYQQEQGLNRLKEKKRITHTGSFATVIVKSY